MSLDDTLAAWAATIRLPAGIYQRIITTPAPARVVSHGLDPAWWRRFTADHTARMIATTRPERWAACPGRRRGASAGAPGGARDCPDGSGPSSGCAGLGRRSRHGKSVPVAACW